MVSRLNHKDKFLFFFERKIRSILSNHNDNRKDWRCNLWRLALKNNMGIKVLPEQTGEKQRILAFFSREISVGNQNEPAKRRNHNRDLPFVNKANAVDAVKIIHTNGKMVVFVLFTDKSSGDCADYCAGKNIAQPMFIVVNS